MEAMGAFFDEEFDSSSKMFFSHEDADLMFQLNGEGNLVIPNESIAGSFLAAAPSIFWPSNEGNNENVAANDFLDYTNLYNICQESSNSTTSTSEGVFVNASQEFDHQTNYDYINLLQVTNDHHSTDDQAMDFCLMDQRNIAVYPNNVVEDIIITCPRDGEMENPEKANAEIQKPANVADSENEMLRKRKFQTEAEEKTIDESSPNPKKKSRVSRNTPKAKRNVHPKSKKNEKAKEVSNEEDEPKMNVQNGHSSCSYNSEDDSNASHEESNVGETSDTKAPAALNLSGKARATRGAATDPQSLYARRRRERINERLRILQNIIPNGTKVDISTMLEEAVHYVKFMQLQIKLLSSDDMWMYAPMVHSGFDISLYGKIFPTL